ncbi:MAG: ABC transporter ATP-binding protein [Solirubrobacteraceae bacterium]
MNGHETMIDVSDVSKRFCRKLKRSLWYGVQDIAKELTGRGQQADNLRAHEFWVLRSVAFRIARGESVGLIGHNGAGKTTLLKMLNGLMKPTQGRITVNGSVRALIALGSGFNPVLTGRENVRIASAVLGYGRNETAAKFEDIVEFAELGEFIDSAVQTYSSGMLARLGFSVAVHTRPDILLVDEVLAVGDLNFAIKCHKKIAEFRNEGGSIILVSHSPYMVRTNCDRAIWLEHGQIQQIGDVNAVCDAYEMAVAHQDASPNQQHYGDGTVELVDLECPETIETGDAFTIDLKLHATRDLVEPIVAINLSAITGQAVVGNSSTTDHASLSIERGLNDVRISYESLPLGRGVYSLSVTVAERYMNNQVLALLNERTFEVQTAPDDFGVGFVKLTPGWERMPA